MSETWEDRFHEFIANWMRGRGYDVKSVYDVDEYAYDAGGCDTCGHDITYQISVSYYDNEDNRLYRNFDGKLAELFFE